MTARIDEHDGGGADHPVGVGNAAARVFEVRIGDPGLVQLGQCGPGIIGDVDSEHPDSVGQSMAGLLHGGQLLAAGDAP